MLYEPYVAALAGSLDQYIEQELRRYDENRVGCS